MWFLWILIVICISLSQQDTLRSHYSDADKFIGKAPPSAFYTEVQPGYYKIKSLSGFMIDEHNIQAAGFDKDFSLRAFHIGFPAKNDIVFEIEIAEKDKTNCFADFFQIPCLCYTDNLEASSEERYGKDDWGYSGDSWSNLLVLNYCGKEHSMICYDYFRDPPAISSNPSTIVDKNELYKLQKGYKNIAADLLDSVYNSSSLKITFTIKKDEPDKVHFSLIGVDEKGIVDIKKFKEETGYEDGDSMEYKIISVLPFHIFAPMCNVTWRFINGKPMSKYPPYSIHVNATVDSKKFVVGDKRTHFVKEEKKVTTESSAAPAITSNDCFIYYFNLLYLISLCFNNVVWE